ncbi:TetR family transcriptional regulator [Paraburkholderia sp. RL16-012-BIC-B]|nr:TetR family transcriptional regulator [Paraburkholderia madseniana]
MSMASQKSTAILSAGSGQAKSPQRARGHARVAALLEAASIEFAEKGYDGATMTAIAARAGSSIGSLYQFFPTKDQIAGALVENYLNMLAETFRKLSEAAPTLDLSLLASRLTRTFLKFRETHPAFVALVETYSYALPGTVSIRERLRGEIESVLAAVAPHLAPAEITVRAAVIQQIMKGAVAINGDTSIAGRKAAIDELEGLMQHYLHEVIKLSR